MSLELDHFIAHASERAPPADKVAVGLVVILTLTFKARIRITGSWLQTI